MTQKRRKPLTKKYRGMDVDARLSASILDRLNSNPNIRVRGVCAGHNHPTEYDQIYHGNVPEVVISPVTKDKRTVCPLVKKHTKDTRCVVSKKHNLVTIRGTKKGTKHWWENVANAISRV